MGLPAAIFSGSGRRRTLSSEQSESLQQFSASPVAELWHQASPLAQTAGSIVPFLHSSLHSIHSLGVPKQVPPKSSEKQEPLVCPLLGGPM